MNNAIILTKFIFLIKYNSIIVWLLFRENKSTSLRDHLTSSMKTNTEAIFKGPKHSTDRKGRRGGNWLHRTEQGHRAPPEKLLAGGGLGRLPVPGGARRAGSRGLG